MNIFKLVGTIFVDSDAAQKSISKTGKEAESLTSKMSKGIATVGKAGLAIAGVAAGAAAGITAMATKAAEATDRIDKMSQKTGVSREAFQELDFITSQCGASMDSLKAGMKTLTTQMTNAEEGSSKATAAFDALGISWEDGTGKLKDQETMMWEAFSALQSMDDQTEKAALATQLFGKAGTELMPMLNGAAGSIEEMKAKAHELGLVMSDESIDAGVQFTDMVDQLKRSFSAVGTEIGVTFMPILLSVGQAIIDHMPEIKAVIQKGVEFVKTIIDGLVEFWQENGDNIISIVKHIFEILKPIIEAGMKVIKGVIEVISALIEGDWSKFWDGIVNILTGLTDILYNVGEAVFTALFDGLKAVWDGIANWVSEKIDWLIDKVKFWDNSKDKMSDGNDSKGSKPNGRHASGLAYVPYDGYKAELHKGETVLNNNDASELRQLLLQAANNQSNSQSETIPINLSINLDGKTLAQALFPYNRGEEDRRGLNLGGVVV